MNLRNSMNTEIRNSACTGLKDVCEMGSLRFSTHPENSGPRSYWSAANFEDDMHQIDDKDDFVVTGSSKVKPTLASAGLKKSFNPTGKPADNWPCKFTDGAATGTVGANLSSSQLIHEVTSNPDTSGNGENDLTFHCEPLAPDNEDEVTESKIRAFSDETVPFAPTISFHFMK